MSVWQKEYAKFSKKRLQGQMFDLSDEDVFRECWSICSHRIAKMFEKRMEYVALGDKKKASTAYANGKIDAAKSFHKALIEDLKNQD